MMHLTQWLFIGGLLTFVSASTMASVVRPVSVADSSSNSSAGDSVTPILTPDGRYVLFTSTAENLVLPTNGSALQTSFPARFNVFLRDRTNETTTLVSVNLNGTGGGSGDSMPMGISTNGRFVLFETSATNLVANDTNNATDVFVRDLVDDTNILVSISTIGKPGNAGSRGPVMTPDGRFVAFVSAATNLVAGDTNFISDVFVRDLQLGTTVLASVGARATTNYPSSSESPEISANGRYVAFYSTATNLISGVARSGELYVRDLVDSTTLFASTNARTALFSVTGNSNAVSFNHAFSADGKFVAYTASITTSPFSGIILRHDLENGVTDLVHTNAHIFYGPREDVRTLDMTPDGRFVIFLANTKTNAGSTFTTPGVWVWDAETGLITLASVNMDNGVAVGSFEWPLIDATGRYVCFVSSVTNLTTNSPLFGYHVFVRDMLLNKTILVDGENGPGLDVAGFAIPYFSPDGRFVAFQASDSQGEVGNTRSNSDVFIRDFQTNATELISVRDPALPSFSPNGPSALSPLSVNANGRYVAFAGLASNLVTNDTNANRDVFVRDLLLETNTLVSVGMNGFSPAGMSFEPSISGDGRFVAFTSMATNLTLGDTNKMRDVFVFDLQTKVSALVSVSTNGMVGNKASFSPVISDDGRFIFFRSKASNLGPGSYTAGSENLIWRDLQNSTTIALTTGGLASAAVTPDGRFAAYRPTNSSTLYIWDSFAGERVYTNSFFNGLVVGISPNGKQVAYLSSTLQALDWMANTNRTIHPVSAIGREGARFSANGELVTFEHPIVNTTGSPMSYDVYLYDFKTKITIRINNPYNMSNSRSAAASYPDISHDGRFVAYRSSATNLVVNDTNNWPDIFIYDRLKGTNTLLSVTRSGNAGNHWSLAPVFSRDGQTLVFPSWASNLVGNDFNQSGDIFAFAFLYATITRNPGEAPIISWLVTPGQTYQAQFKNSLNDLNWQPVNGSIVITGNQASLQDLSPDAGHRIYRIVGF